MELAASSEGTQIGKLQATHGDRRGVPAAYERGSHVMLTLWQRCI